MERDGCVLAIDLGTGGPKAALVDRAARIVHDVGRRPASAAEAREILGLAPR